MVLNIIKLKKSKELALFLGMFVGDGCLSIKCNGNGYRIYPISFYNTNRYYVKLFSKLFLKLFGVVGKIKARRRCGKLLLWEFEKYSVELYKIINKDFEIFCGKKATNVKIPSFILNGNKIIKKYFFYGLLITDGGIRKNGTIIFHLGSRKLIYGLKNLIKNTFMLDKEVKVYLQNSRFISYQLNLNKEESSGILSQMPRSHNLVVR